MSARAADVLSIALSQNSITDILTEEREVFGPVYGQVVEFVGDYHAQYGEPPTVEIVNKHFDDNVVSHNTEGNLRYEIDAMRQDYVKSSVDNMLVTLAKNLDAVPTDELLAKIISRATKLQRLTNAVKDIDITDVDIALQDFARARLEDENGAGIMTGIEAWDTAIPMGMRPGQSITLMGYSGKGKSFIADYLAAQAYFQGKTVMLVSLEMSAEEQRARIWSIIAQGKFFINALNNGEVSDSEITAWGAENLKTGGKIIVIEQEGHADVTPGAVQAKIDKHRPHMVIFDYLQLMMDNGKSKDMTPRMMNLSREIKLLATTNKIICVSVTAVTDDESKKRDSPPRMAQVAWSKAIEYDSDLVVVVHRYEDTPYMELVARKVRRSDFFAMRFSVDLARGIFTPMMGDEDED